MKIFSRTMIPILILVADLGAQATTRVVFPVDHARLEGAYALNGPISLPNSRSQILYDSWALPIPDKRMVSAVGFRQNVNSVWKSVKVELQIQMGYSKFDSRSMNSWPKKFFSNYAGTPTVTFKKKIYSPPSFASSKGPSQNFAMIKLDKPFPFSKSKNLIVDWFLFRNANSNKAFSYIADFADAIRSTKTFGRGCLTSGKTSATIYSTAAALGEGWGLSISSTAQSAGAVFVGVNRKTLGSIPLPLSLKSLGAPGCSLLVSPLFSLPYSTDSRGIGRAGMIVPEKRMYDGLTFYAQAFTLDLFANKLGLVLTQGTETTFRMRPRAAGRFGSAASPGISSGINQYGLVTGFDYN